MAAILEFFLLFAHVLNGGADARQEDGQLVVRFERGGKNFGPPEPLFEPVTAAGAARREECEGGRFVEESISHAAGSRAVVLFARQNAEESGGERKRENRSAAGGEDAGEGVAAVSHRHAEAPVAHRPRVPLVGIPRFRRRQPDPAEAAQQPGGVSRQNFTPRPPLLGRDDTQQLRHKRGSPSAEEGVGLLVEHRLP